MMGSKSLPDLLAIHCTPRAIPPPVTVAMALFSPLYKQPPVYGQINQF